MLDELGNDYIMINGSDEGRTIDTLRVKIKQFASSVSLAGGRKYVIIDEADYVNPESTQPALRNFMEEFSKNCGFILTCNFKNRIIEPLHSRCSVIDFKIPKEESPILASNFMSRVFSILKNENVDYVEEVVAQFITKHFPDWRRVINELQRYSVHGTIDTGILSSISDDSFKTLIQLLKTKNFTEVRKWVGLNIDNEPSLFFRKLYDNLGQYMKPKSIPQVVLVLADYQYKSAFVADQEINFVACLTQIMVEADWQD